MHIGSDIRTLQSTTKQTKSFLTEIEDLLKLQGISLNLNSLQLSFRDDRPLLDRPFALEKGIKKAQVRAFLAGDPVYEEAFHRIYLDRAWWKTFWYLNQINPEDNEFLPIPYHHRPSDGKFTFHDEKLNYR